MIHSISYQVHKRIRYMLDDVLVYFRMLSHHLKLYVFSQLP